MAENTARRAPSARPHGASPWHALLVVGLGLLFAAGVVVYSVVFFGHVRGQEFAPHSFARREFSYFEIPLVGLQISPVFRQDVTNDLESHLAGEKLVAGSKKTSAERWDLVVARRGTSQVELRIISQGNARILCEYLDAQDSRQAYIWLDWTNRNPELAKVVWPAVARLARQDLYVFAPELLRRASQATDPVQLQTDMNGWLVERYLAFGRIQQQLSNHEAAVELFTAALQLVPSHADAQAQRAQSLSALGRSDASPSETESR
jgi:hypothetical protein